MKRTNKKDFQADLIISGDWHLMEEERTPPCRLDSIWEAQWNKIQQIKVLQQEHKCPIWLSGDMFEHWKTSPNLLNMAIFTMEDMDIRTVIGNHDMPQHNYDLIKKSGVETLCISGMVNPFDGQGDWGRKPTGYREYQQRKIVISHEMTYLDEEPYPGCTDPECKALFKKYPKADLIITGHNHETFVARRGGRLLINPGSLTRHKADQIDHKPCVFLWNAESNEYKIHYLKIKPDVISREHIQMQNQKEQNIQNFLTKLKETWEIGLSFEDNIMKALESNKIPPPVKEIILKWVGK